MNLVLTSVRLIHGSPRVYSFSCFYEEEAVPTTNSAAAILSAAGWLAVLSCSPVIREVSIRTSVHCLEVAIVKSTNALILKRVPCGGGSYFAATRATSSSHGCQRFSTMRTGFLCVCRVVASSVTCTASSLSAPPVKRYRKLLQPSRRASFYK